MKMKITKTTVKITFTIAVILFVLCSFLAYSFLNKTSNYQTSTFVNKQTVPISKKQTQDDIWYDGQNGITALNLLKEKLPVEQNASGLVTAINNRKADDFKHEYWAFYINGKLSNVGAQQYITRDGDKLEWKIEIY